MYEWQYAVYSQIPANGHQDGQQQKVEKESVGKKSPGFGPGYDEHVQRAINDVGQDGHQSDKTIIQMSPEGELLRYPNRPCGIA